MTDNRQHSVTTKGLDYAVSDTMMREAAYKYIGIEHTTGGLERTDYDKFTAFVNGAVWALGAQVKLDAKREQGEREQSL